MKPTAGRMDDPADFGIALGQRAIVSQAGAMARSVDDVALALEILNGGRAPDRRAADAPRRSASVDLAYLRVAYYTDDGTFAVAPPCAAPSSRRRASLAGRGAQVIEWRPPNVPRRWSDLLRRPRRRRRRARQAHAPWQTRKTHAWRCCCCSPRRSRPAVAVARRRLRARRAAPPRRHAPRLRPPQRRRATSRLAQAQAAYRRQFAAALDTDEGGPFDLIVCPACCAARAIPHGSSRDLVTAGGYAALYNVLGYPTGVVPVTRVREDEESQRKRSLDPAEGVAQATETRQRGAAGGRAGRRASLAGACRLRRDARHRSCDAR